MRVLTVVNQRNASLVRTALIVAALTWGRPANAQVTAATIRGAVRSPNGEPVADAMIVVTNRATGYHVTAQVANGRYRVPGLEVGGPYTVLLRRLGYAAQERTNLYLTLDRDLELNFVMERASAMLDTVLVVMQAG